MRFKILLWSALLLMSLTATAQAYEDTCPANVPWNVGVQRSMRLVIAEAEHDTLTRAVQQYARRHGLFWSSSGPGPGPRYPVERYHWTLGTTGRFEAPGGVIIAILIETSATGRDDIALVEISTTCFMQEDWRPHWREFEEFITARFQRLDN